MLTRGTGQDPVSYSPMTGRPRLCLRRRPCGERRAQLALRSFSSASGALRATDRMPFSMPAADEYISLWPMIWPLPAFRAANKTKHPSCQIRAMLRG